MRITRVDPSTKETSYRKVGSLKSGLYLDPDDDFLIYSVDQPNEVYTKFNLSLGRIGPTNWDPNDKVNVTPYKGILTISGGKD